ncbi:hypothetical protein LTR62_006144 [Meristemomyces frigidus]|uniref:Cytochrome b5 heme-binding domain-containing protein n=1 Tax=Meristemomyces frigidus TaxID=1508187 RepID=A0AAN7TCY3_9PEZI|nr:hypothetical protein LTR62_006144 [Meristemomyces frigidus]
MGFMTVATLILATLLLIFYGRMKMSWNMLPSWPSSENPASTLSNNKPPDDKSKHDQQPMLDKMPDLEEAEDGEKTPKAEARNVTDDVPSFTLSTGDIRFDAREADVPAFPAINSAQRAKPSGQTMKSTTSSLMPPPSRPAPINRHLAPSTSSSLRIPSTGPLPNRGPPQSSQQRLSSSLSPNGTAKAVPNPRGKVLLSPGHSPMDWAALIKKGNLSGVNGFQRITPSQLKKMTGRKGKPAWSSWQGKVYNITPYLPFHPGGEAELMKCAGRDGAKLFMEVHPWVNWENMLGSCLVGVLVPEEQSPLEDMD